VRSCKILVVEDFALFRQFVLSSLRQRAEFQLIYEASDGLEAVQRAEELQPDLILLDIGLPKLNGIEAARQMRQQETTHPDQERLRAEETTPESVKGLVPALAGRIEMRFLPD